MNTIFQTLVYQREKGQDAVLATIIWDDGSAPRGAGSQMLVGRNGLLAGTIGTMIGYAVSKTRRSRWANYVNAVAFLPYLMPSIAVGVAFFVLFSNRYVNLFNTYTLLIICLLYTSPSPRDS